MKRGLLFFLVVALNVARAQDAATGSRDVQAAADTELRLVTWNEGVEIIRVAWQNLSKFDSPIDCSHLVNEIYDLAGLHYPYATSNQLYGGVDGFERVRSPQPADLIVWPGHVGIIVNPQEHSFYSSLNSGLKIDSYDAPAWRARGPARFFRFVLRGGEKVRSVSTERAAASREDQSAFHDDTTSDHGTPAATASSRQPGILPESPHAIFLKWERPTKGETQDLLLREWSNTSDDRQDRWEQAREVVIVETLKVHRIHLSAATGTVETRIRSAARLTPDGMQVRSATEEVSFHLRRSQNGWKIDDPSGRMYLSGDAAVVAVSERLAGIARESASRAEQAQAAALLQSLLR